MNEITIKASDGKVFKGTIDTYGSLLGELNAYEADLELKKKKESEKIEEAVKAFKELEEMVESLKAAIKEYELATNIETYFYIENGELKIGRDAEFTNSLIKNLFGI